MVRVEWGEKEEKIKGGKENTLSCSE